MGVGCWVGDGAERAEAGEWWLAMGRWVCEGLLKETLGPMMVLLWSCKVKVLQFFDLLVGCREIMP